MSKDLHIFTNGMDPFVFMVEGVTIHVHSGEPGQTLASAPTEPTDTTPAPRPKRTPLPPPMRIRAPENPDSFDDWIHRFGEEEYDQDDERSILLGIQGHPDDPTDVQDLLHGLQRSEEQDITVAYLAPPGVDDRRV